MINAGKLIHRPTRTKAMAVVVATGAFRVGRMRAMSAMFRVPVRM